MLVALLIYFLAFSSKTEGVFNDRLARGIDGGYTCAACTILVSTIDQLAEIHNQTIIEALDGFCLMLPKKFQSPCQELFEIFGPLIVDMAAEKANSDDICRGLGFCYTDKGQKTCALYKKTLKFDEQRIFYHQTKTKKYLNMKYGLPMRWDICEIPGINILCKIYNNTFDKHVPSQDDDGDTFSLVESLRGSSWKGKDCDDSRNDVYPGRKPELLKDLYFDSNCNGILGLNNVTGKTYEEELCAGTGQMGIVVIGDSVGAHFHAPEEWFSPPLLTAESLKSLPFALENELDWPQLSLVTGYMQSKWGVARGKTDSLYLRLLQRNRCNHRDYQNLAVNGDDSFEVQGFIKSLARHKKTDFPQLIILELVGNDVCNHYIDTIAKMTTTEQMHKNLLSLFSKLNDTVPAGSKVLIVGMADGDFLYNFLHNRTHPFGRWRNDLIYSEVYDWWECLQVTPCKGWLSNNATLRAYTTQRAVELSKVMQQVADTYKHHWKNLELNYLECPIITVIKKYLVEHGPQSGWQLIEPVDGFHPNQLGQALSAAEVWRHLELNLPHYLGPLNKNNDKIKKIFGDQGGY